eukprot:Skav231738  [mRNA]  locus=scaffold638:182574:184173:- [translate_table: standard]
MRSIGLFLACSVVVAQCHVEVADEAPLGECEIEALKVQLVQTKVKRLMPGNGHFKGSSPGAVVGHVALPMRVPCEGLHPPDFGPGLELLELGSTRADFLEAVDRLDARVRALDQVLAKVEE